MPGTQSFINPAFPSVVGSQQTPPPGVRAELFTYRATGNYYEWSVPPRVYFAKVTIVGGSGGNENITGGTTSFDTIATATGGTSASTPTCCGPVCSSSTGSFSVSTTRLTQLTGANYSSVNQYIRSYGISGNNNASGGQGVVYLENLIPGTIFRITIGVVATGGPASGNGCCLIEY